MSPIEVEIDQLVLYGVEEPDAPAVLAAFRRHLVAVLGDPGGPPQPVTNASAQHEGEGQPLQRDSERLGRELALAVARAVRR